MFYENLKRRRSVRTYEKQEVEKEKIDIILKSALLSPSSRSLRPWHFIAVNDKQLLERLSICKEAGSSFLKEAPFAIIVLADSKKSDVWIEDTSIASTIIQLTAHDLGLGSCWIQVRERFHSSNETSENYIRKLLEIPDDFKVASIIAIGYPDKAQKPYLEENLLYEKIHYNKF